MVKVSKVVAVAVAAVVVASSVPAGAGPTSKRRARVAARYVMAQQEDDGSFVAFSTLGGTADGVVSLVAAERGKRRVRRAIRFLKAHIEEATTIGLKAKVAMAAAAAGRNPRAFAGHDLISEIIDSQQPDGNYGGESLAEVFDHALAMLALTTVVDAPLDPDNDSVAARQWLIDAQCRDGGWQFDEPASASEDEHCVDPANPMDFDRSNADTTGLAVQALRGFLPELGADPFGFFEVTRDPEKNGWGYDASFPLTNTNSTALVIQAHAAAERDLPRGAMGALRALQRRLCGRKAGAFSFTWEDDDGDGRFRRTGPDLGATIGGILGLLRQPLPVASGGFGTGPRIRPCN